MCPHYEEIAHEVAMGEHRIDGWCLCGHTYDDHLPLGTSCEECDCICFEEEW